MPSHGPFQPGMLGSPEEWRPTFLPNLVTAFDIRANVTFDGSNTITTWDKRYGDAYYYSTSGTTTKYIAGGWTNSGGTILPCARGNGTTDELICSNLIGGLSLGQRLFGGNDTPGTHVLVAKLTSVAGSRVLSSFSSVGGSGSTQQLVLIGKYSTTDWSAYKQGDGGAGDSANLADVGIGKPNTAKHVFVLSAGPTTAAFYIDGVLVASGAFNTGVATFDRTELFARNGSNNAAADIVVADYYSDEKSPADVALISAGYAAIWL